MSHVDRASFFPLTRTSLSQDAEQHKASTAARQKPQFECFRLYSVVSVRAQKHLFLLLGENGFA